MQREWVFLYKGASGQPKLSPFQLSVLCSSGIVLHALTPRVASAPPASATWRQSSSLTASFFMAEQHDAASIAESGLPLFMSSRNAMCNPSLASERLFWNALLDYTPSCLVFSLFQSIQTPGNTGEAEV